MKKRILVVCPGRGSYTKQNLGSLQNSKVKFSGKFSEFLHDIDQRRQNIDEISISDLDAKKTFMTSLHTKGEHASPLIYACAYQDFLRIDQDKYEIVAICGNSMGWYLSLAFSEVLDWKNSFDLIQTMGSMMKDGLIGAQIIYPIIDENWVVDDSKVTYLNKMIAEANKTSGGQVYISIHLGGYKVLAGDTEAISYLLKNMKKEGDYPFQLINHGAFHTPLLKAVSDKALQIFNVEDFHKPKYPIIDGRGHIFNSYSSDAKDIFEYTLGHQVVETYDFTKSLEVGLKEFAPDQIFLLGPGNSLGGVIGQTLIKCNWKSLKSKNDFQETQKKDPFLISMGLN